MKLHLSRSSNLRRRGTAIVMVALLLISLAALSLAMISMSGAGFLEGRSAKESMRAFQLCEAGLSEAWAVLQAHEEGELVVTSAEPLEFGTDKVDITVTLGSTDPTLGFDRLLISASAKDGTHSNVNTVVVRKIPNGQFKLALFGYRGVTLESNSLIDSYNSQMGEYDPDYPGQLAHVGSNGDIELNANVHVYGDVTAGPDGVVDESNSGNAVVGEMGSSTDLYQADPIEVPPISGTGALVVNATETLGPGDIHLSKLKVQSGASLTIIGPARLVLDDFEMLSNSSVDINALEGAVEIHCTGHVKLKSNSNLTTQSNEADDILLNVSWDSASAGRYEFDLSSNSQFSGVINAPHSDVVMASNFELFGSIYGRTLTLESNAQVHFDENLLFDDGVPVEYERVSWSTTAKK